MIVVVAGWRERGSESELKSEGERESEEERKWREREIWRLGVKERIVREGEEGAGVIQLG